MNLAELIEEARERVDDNVPNPYLVSDERWAAFANDAEREAARRARLIVDTSSQQFCRIVLGPNQALYPLDPKVLFVRRARVEGRESWLRRLSHKDLDPMGTSWLSATGEVEGFVPDLESRKFRPYRIPEVTTIAWLVVVRLPVEDMAQDEDEPEIPEAHHMGLVDWMEHRFYRIQDAEIRDEKAAGDALARFEANFGKRSSAIEEAWIEANHGFIEDEGLF